MNLIISDMGLRTWSSYRVDTRDSGNQVKIKTLLTAEMVSFTNYEINIEHTHCMERVPVSLTLMCKSVIFVFDVVHLPTAI